MSAGVQLHNDDGFRPALVSLVVAIDPEAQHADAMIRALCCITKADLTELASPSDDFTAADRELYASAIMAGVALEQEIVQQRLAELAPDRLHEYAPYIDKAKWVLQFVIDALSLRAAQVLGASALDTPLSARRLAHLDAVYASLPADGQRDIDRVARDAKDESHAL